MEDSTKAEEDIDDLFQDDDPSTVIENIELKFPISPVAHSSLEEREEVSVSEIVEDHMEKMMHLAKGLDEKVQENILKSQKKERKSTTANVFLTWGRCLEDEGHAQVQ